MNNTKVFEATQRSEEQTATYAALGLTTGEYWETQAATLKTKLDAAGIDHMDTDNAQIVAAVPEFFTGRGENESASIIATMRALRFYGRTFAVEDPAVMGHAGAFASAAQAGVPEAVTKLCKNI